MENALGEQQTIVLLGGTSDIGLAIVRRLLGPTTRTVVLACRDVERGERAARWSASRFASQVDVVAFEAAAPETHAEFARSIVGEVRRHRRRHRGVRGARRRCGRLVRRCRGGGDRRRSTSPASVSATIALANQMREQGHGSIVMLSSVAGERVRKVNPVYGGTKAGIDGFAQGLGDALVDDGVHMLIVRPGFVRTKMTSGKKAAPFATTPDAVAEATARALRARRRMVWVPGILRYVFSVLRHLPAPVWRRLPLD